MPSIVERICVLLSSLKRLDMPFFTISRFSLAFCSSSSALARAVRLCSASSSETTPFACRAVVRSCSRRVCASEISATETRDSALDSWPISGTTFTVAITSPLLTDCPASLRTLEMMPEIWGLISTSSRGSTLPVATTNCLSVFGTGSTIV